MAQKGHQGHDCADVRHRGNVHLHHRLPVSPRRILVGSIHQGLHVLERRRSLCRRRRLEHCVGLCLDDLAASCSLEVTNEQAEAIWSRLYAGDCVSVSIHLRLQAFIS